MAGWAIHDCCTIDEVSHSSTSRLQVDFADLKNGHAPGRGTRQVLLQLLAVLCPQRKARIGLNSRERFDHRVEDPSIVFDNDTGMCKQVERPVRLFR